jgi:hypothetical protein
MFFKKLCRGMALAMPSEPATQAALVAKVRSFITSSLANAHIIRPSLGQGLSRAWRNHLPWNDNTSSESFDVAFVHLDYH